jgi:hypothetical protein
MACGAQQRYTTSAIIVFKEKLEDTKMDNQMWSIEDGQTLQRPKEKWLEKRSARPH